MNRLPGLPQGTIKVDCGSCHKCCRGHQLIVLAEGEDPAAYDCYERRPGMWALKRNANGDCIYLGESGCTIWGRHPAVCKLFDCAGFVKRMDEGAFAGIGLPLDDAMIKEGRKRLRRMGGK